jgi:hypothetical protein
MILALFLVRHGPIFLERPELTYFKKTSHLHQIGFFLGLGLLVFTCAIPALGKIDKSGARLSGAEPDLVFEAIATAWELGDEDALAKLVHENGLRVTSGDYNRFTDYSPSQAFYYCRNQFRTYPTVSFGIERMQKQMSGQDRVHGMVSWQYQRTRGGPVQELKLVLVLTRQGSNWRLAEINTINKR